MKYITIPLDQTIAYEKGIDGMQLVTIYGEKLAPMIYEYCETSNPIVFDRNKDLIREIYKDYIKKKDKISRKHAELFFYRLKKIIYLTDEFKKADKWKNPVVCRDSILKGFYAVSVGVDRWHVLRSFGIKQYEFLLLSNIEFSADFKPKLQTLFTPDTEFEHYYSEHSQRYKFEIKPNFVESTNFNLKQWLKIPYIEGHPSAIIAQPNRVSLRDAAIAKLQNK